MVLWLDLIGERAFDCAWQVPNNNAAGRRHAPPRPCGPSRIDNRPMLRKTPKCERSAFVASPAPEAKKALARLVKRYGNVTPSKADVVVALGGDGLMLRTLRQGMKARPRVYSLHPGHSGL